MPDALHIATEGPLGLAARRMALSRGWRFTTSFHTMFPDYLQARMGIPAALPAWCRSERPEVVIFGNYDPASPFVLPRGVDTVALDVISPDGELTGIFQDHQRVGAIAVEHLVSRLQRGEYGANDRARLHLLAGTWAPGKTAPGLRAARAPR